MELTVYSAKWFSKTDWSWNEIEILAESKEKVEQYVDTVCNPTYRTKPYDITNTDSLKIESLYSAKLPFVIKGDL